MLVVLGLATGIATASTATSVRVGKSIDPALVQKLQENARGSVSISTKRSTKFASFVRVGRNGDLIPAETTKSLLADILSGSFRAAGALAAPQPVSPSPVPAPAREYKQVPG